jgi:molecular chaperone Hsp33
MRPADQIVRCVIDGGAARVVAVTTTGVAREAARRHEASAAAAVALARGLTAGLLLATLTKDDERVTLQVLGDGPFGGLTVDATAAGTARAYVKNPAVRLPLPPASRPDLRLSLAAGIGRSGLVNVIRDLGLRENFNGQTALVSGEIDEDVEQYLIASEQIDSALGCEAALGSDGDVAASAGLLVQALPGSEGASGVGSARARLRDGALLRALAAGAIEAEQLIQMALGPEIGALEVLDVRPVSFRCPCSRGRAGSSLALLGQAELSDMILEDGRAEVICNFCRARYEFTEAELETIRREIGKPAGPPS